MKNFNLRTAERWITSTRFGRSLLGLKDPAELAGLLSDSFAGVESGTYTPSLTNVTLGTGSPVNTAFYVFTGGHDSGDRGLMQIWGTLTLGTGGSLSGIPAFGLPSGFQIVPGILSSLTPIGRHYDDSSATDYVGHMRPSGTSAVAAVIERGDLAYVGVAAISGTVPFAWTAGDDIYWTASFPAERT